jgi:hypothetical protein
MSRITSERLQAAGVDSHEPIDPIDQAFWNRNAATCKLFSRQRRALRHPELAAG